MIKAQTPDDRIKTANDLMTKFADTEFMSIAMLMTAEAYEQKNDFEKMQVWCEKTTRGGSEELLVHAHDRRRHRQARAGQTTSISVRSWRAWISSPSRRCEVVKDAPKPNPGIPDDQWASAKKDYASQAHEAFALAAMLRKKYDVAIAEFKEAVDGAGTPDPATMVRFGQCYDQAGKPDDAIAILDKVMAMSNVHPQIRQFAQAERVRAIQAKGKRSAAPPPAARPATAPAADAARGASGGDTQEVVPERDGRGAGKSRVGAWPPVSESRDSATRPHSQLSCA